MILRSDILRYIDTPQTFQRMCAALALKKIPESVPVLEASHDQGMDILSFCLDEGDTVLECKYFVKGFGSSQRAQIRRSLQAVSQKKSLHRWVLCLPVSPSGRFLNWLREEVKRICPDVAELDVWGADKLIAMLNEYHDIRDQFFYPLYQEFARTFRSDDLELLTIAMAQECIGWKQESNTLSFLGQADGRGDLIVDIVVRNPGTISTVLSGLSVEIADVRRLLRGFRGAARLDSLATYDLCLRNGSPGRESVRMDPPIGIPAADVARFKVRLTEAGFAWTGVAQIALNYGNQKWLELPWIGITV